MTISQRVERIRTILSDFQSSPLIKSLAGTALVKPPIVKTNVILKNPDFKKAMQTWQFIERYNEAGLIVKVVENHNLPNNDFIEDILTNLALQYVTFAHHNRPSKENIPSNVEAKEFVPVLISRIVEEYIDEYSYDFVKIEKVFVEQLKKVTAKHKENEIKVQKALERVINKEKARLAKEKLANKRKYANFVDDYDDRFYEDKKETIQPNVEEVAPPIISIKQDEKQEAILSVNLKETQQVIEEKEVVEKVIIEEEVVEVVKEEVIEEKVIKEVTKEVDVPPVNVIENVIKNEVFKFEIVKVGEDPSLKVSRRVLRKANKKKRKEKVKANIPVRKVIYRKPNKYK